MNWWEGNVTMGPGGVLYAGNTGGAEYALNPNGRLRWVLPDRQLGLVERGDRATTAASTSARSTSTIYAVDPRGQLQVEDARTAAS